MLMIHPHIERNPLSQDNVENIKEPKINKKYDITLHFILYYGFWKQIMIFQAFLNSFTCYLLNGAFFSLEYAFCPCFLWFATFDFFYIVFFFVSSMSGRFCTLFLVYLSTCGFFNIFQLMLPTPISCNIKLILLDTAFETIIILSS